MSRTSFVSLCSVLLCALLLSACSGGGERKRVFPPNASVQELTVRGDGAWTLALRLQNFSNVPQHFTGFDAVFTIDGQFATTLRPSTDITVGPESVEILSLALTPSAPAAEALRNALESSRSVQYKLAGEIVSSEPNRRRDDFSHESQLTPVPGLPGVLR